MVNQSDLEGCRHYVLGDIGMICIWDMTQCAKPPPSSDFWTSRRLDVTHLTLSDSSCSRKQSRGLTDGLHHPLAPPHCHNSSRPACTPTVNLAGFDVQTSDVLDIVASDPPTRPPALACTLSLNSHHSSGKRVERVYLQS